MIQGKKALPKQGSETTLVVVQPHYAPPIMEKQYDRN
jgi:hypothetical protein